MNRIQKIVTPFLLIVIGLLLLFILGQAEIAGICLLVGIVSTINLIIPEKWG